MGKRSRKGISEAAYESKSVKGDEMQFRLTVAAATALAAYLKLRKISM